VIGVFVALEAVLGVTFGSAALAKAGRQADVRKAAIELGAPAVLATPLGVVVPVVEALITAGLLAERTARFAGITAAIVLVLFTAAVIRTLASGRRPACNCFGAKSDEPIGWKTLLRNGVLLALAIVIAAGPAPGVWTELVRYVRTGRGADVVLLALVAVVTVEGVVIAHLLSGRAGRALPPAADQHLEAEGLPVGTPAPPFQLPDLDGVDRTLDELLQPSVAALIVFVDPACGPCNALLPEVADWHKAYETSLQIITVSRGTAEANRDKLAGFELEPVLLQELDEVAVAYGAGPTPSAVLVTAGRRIGSAVAVGAHEIRHLAERAVASADAATDVPNPPPVGEPAPIFSLPGLDGEDVPLIDGRGRLTVVLFWSPTCVFCRELREDLRQWEAAADGDLAPRLVVVTSGSVRANRAERFAGPVAVDDGQLTRRAYGFSGTPQAILVDGSGRIASEMAQGAEQIMSLLARASELAGRAGHLAELATRRRVPVSADRPRDGG
jgi:thiol-disulfide isomerase/thioredoxin